MQRDELMRTLWDQAGKRRFPRTALQWVALVCMVLGLVVIASIVCKLADQGFLHPGASVDTEVGSQIGDLLGGLATVFWTAAATLLLYDTLTFQRRESADTRRALHVTQFEGSFFSMLAHLERIVADCEPIGAEETVGRGHPQGGRRYFRTAFEDLEARHNSVAEPVVMEMLAEQALGPGKPHPETFRWDPERLKPAVLKAYECFYGKHEINLAHYFRFVFNIFKYVATDESLTIEEKSKYIGFLQARTSNDELALLFYNGLSVHAISATGEPVFHDWLDEYEFFQNVDDRCLFHEEYAAFYRRTKFKFIQRRPTGAQMT
jgi:hypothetical protein